SIRQSKDVPGTAVAYLKPGTTAASMLPHRSTQYRHSVRPNNRLQEMRGRPCFRPTTSLRAGGYVTSQREAEKQEPDLLQIALELMIQLRGLLVMDNARVLLRRPSKGCGQRPQGARPRSLKPPTAATQGSSARANQLA